MKVLIVDDELPARKRLERMVSTLEPEAEVHQAEDGEEAEEML